MSLIEQLKYQFKSGGTYLKIIYINIGVFLFLLILNVFAALMKFGNFIDLTSYLELSSSPYTFLRKPWTLLTYMFVHLSIGHIFWNMILYFFAGRIFEDILGKKAALKTYLIGGSVAGLLHIITYNIFPLYRDLPESPVIGASGAVMAIFVGLATYTPNYEAHLFGVLKIKLKYLAIGFVILDILGVANTGDRVAHFAHIGGAVWGFLYASNIKKGKDISNWITAPINAFIGIFKKKKLKLCTKAPRKNNNPKPLLQTPKFDKKK